MVSPIEGSIADVNDSVSQRSEAGAEGSLRRRLAGNGAVPDAKTNFRNLIGGAMARWWTEESSGRLQRKMPMFAGALAQDGGVAVGDLTEQIPDQESVSITKEFFLS